MRFAPEDFGRFATHERSLKHTRVVDPAVIRLIGGALAIGLALLVERLLLRRRSTARQQVRAAAPLPRHSRYEPTILTSGPERAGQADRLLNDFENVARHSSGLIMRLGLEASPQRRREMEEQSQETLQDLLAFRSYLITELMRRP